MMPKHSLRSSLAFVAIAGASWFFVPQSYAAEKPAGTPGYEASPQLQRHHRMAELMERMQAQMEAMAKKMEAAELTSQERKSMSEDMTRMASIMRRMSGLTDRPSMRDEDARRQLDAMSKEMSSMQKRHALPGPSAPANGVSKAR
jgi:cell pole-organizing protein PopZ